MSFSTPFCQIIEELDDRFKERTEELVETLTKILPSPPTEMETDEVIGEEKEDTPEGEQEEVMT